MPVNLVITRGLKKLAYGRFLSISRFRRRLGLPSSPLSSGPLYDDSDWSYPDGTPGEMTKGRSLKYMRDQDWGRVMLKYGEQFKAIEKMRSDKSKRLDDLGAKN